jgi:hypothetical protein
MARAAIDHGMNVRINAAALGDRIRRSVLLRNIQEQGGLRVDQVLWKWTSAQLA